MADPELPLRKSDFATVNGQLVRAAGGPVVAAENVSFDDAVSEIGAANIQAAIDALKLVVDGFGLPTLSAVLGEGNNAGNTTITGLPAPNAPSDAATMSWVQTAIMTAMAGTAPTKSVKAMYATNVPSLSTVLTPVDGQTISADDVVLLTAQTNQIQNGPWVVKSGSWVRPTWFANGSDAASFTIIVQAGSVYQDTWWQCTNNTGAAVIGTDNLVFQRFGATPGLSAVLAIGASAASIEITSIAAATSATSATRPDGRVYNVTNTPAAEAGVCVTAVRTVDGARVIRAIANVYQAELVALVNTNSATTTQIAELHLENNTRATIAVEVHAQNTAQNTQATVQFRCHARVDGSGVVTVSDLTTTYPDANPAVEPNAASWILAYVTFLTTSTATNKFRLSAAHSTTDAISWTTTVHATVTGV